MPIALQKIEPKGTYLRPLDPKDLQLAPTAIKITSLGLVGGDYLGLSSMGAFQPDKKSKDDNITLNAVFIGAGGQHLRPAMGCKFHAANTAIKPGSAYDFVIAATQTIIRIPLGAVEIQFSGDDALFRDNEDPNKDFKVRISTPNRFKPHPFPVVDHFDPPPVDPHYTACDGPHEVGSGDSAQDSIELPLNGNILSSVFGLGDPLPMQYRGYFGDKGAWNPQLSKFGPRPNGRQHRGIDIFAPLDCDICSPIDGVVDLVSVDPPGWGKFVRLKYLHRAGEQRYMLFAHLDTTRVTGGKPIGRGQIIGTAGCSGNADSGEACRKEAPNGGLTNHVHLEVSTGPNTGFIDPVADCGWQVLVTT